MLIQGEIFPIFNCKFGRQHEKKNNKLTSGTASTRTNDPLISNIKKLNTASFPVPLQHVYTTNRNKEESHDDLKLPEPRSSIIRSPNLNKRIWKCVSCNCSNDLADEICGSCLSSRINFTREISGGG